MLYPLFVHNIGALLYHPTNQSRTTQVMAAAERRKQQDQGQMRNPPGLPSIQQHHHHSMALPGPQPSLPSQTNMARPPLDRAHTFPTPPTTASGVMGSMGPSEGFNWQGQGINGGQGAWQQVTLAISRPLTTAVPSLVHAATTPPGSSMSNLQSYSSAAQGYDASRPMYSAPASQQSPYQSASNGAQDRIYAQPPSYPKSEMGPPATRPPPGGHHAEQHESKQQPNGILPSEQTAQHQAGDDEADHEHEAEYTHDSGTYDASRTSYNYTAPGVGSLAGEGNITSDMTGSPSHPPASGRATPRTAAPHQSYYPQHAGYSTPPRIQSSSSLYNVMTSDRAPANGAQGNDVYAPSADMTSSINGYASQAPVINGSGGIKRGRDDDDDVSRSSDGPGSMGLDLKRRKTMMETSVSAPAYDALTRPASAIAAPPRR